MACNRLSSFSPTNASISKTRLQIMQSHALPDKSEEIADRNSNSVAPEIPRPQSKLKETHQWIDETACHKHSLRLDDHISDVHLNNVTTLSAWLSFSSILLHAHSCLNGTKLLWNVYVIGKTTMFPTTYAHIKGRFVSSNDVKYCFRRCKIQGT